MTSAETLKKVLKEHEMTLGHNETLKKVKRGNVTTVFLSSDCKPEVRKSMQYYKTIGSFTVVDLEITGHEVGTLCKKLFPISVLSY